MLVIFQMISQLQAKLKECAVYSCIVWTHRISGLEQIVGASKAFQTEA